MDVVKGEPILGLGLLQALIGLLLAFGVDLNNEQVGSIMAVSAIVLAIVGRLLVVPLAKFRAKQAEAMARLNTEPPPPAPPTM